VLREEAVESVAVCFLHSWRDGRHEREAADALRAALPGLHVTLSSEVLPQIKEFERFSTAVVNAYVGPAVGRYLDRLAARLEARATAARSSSSSATAASRPWRKRRASPPAPRFPAPRAASRRPWRWRRRRRARPRHLRHGRHLHRHRLVSAAKRRSAAGARWRASASRWKASTS
jgi:hypothetical protein